MSFLVPACDCWAATIRIVNRSRRRQPTDSINTTPELQAQDIPAILHLGRNLTQHWKRLNSCVHSATHLSAPALMRSLADALRNTLSLYEAAGGPNGLLTETLGVEIPAFMGEFQLEPDEVAIVTQEALWQLLMQMGDMIQEMLRVADDQQESQQKSQQKSQQQQQQQTAAKVGNDGGDEGAYMVLERDQEGLRNLNRRLFRLLMTGGLVG
ncbi:hypothetical protein B0H66DRAFT_561523 [Apodospora peruviana]|uniref:Uncharacterized protein n=1 Tax=Apodospora peruviana TaxID=516989 RepID=A0AAE0M3G7_9PEZI|nr:hypothetical protein B0H66DRAFT_561523 [Apodospora peruviana]